MKKVLFIYPKKASFISLDIAILSEKYTIIENTYNWKNKFLLPLFLIQQFFFILFKIKSIDYIIVSFGGYWSVLPSFLGRIFKKPVFIILHGTDCTGFKEINYGNMRKPLMKLALKISYKYATRLLPVSKSLVYTENTYYSKNKIIQQGYKHYFKNNSTPYSVINNGIDTKKWHIDENVIKKENRFITVLSEGQFILKGGDLIIEAAIFLPEHEFILIGLDKPQSLKTVSSNVKFITRQTPEELLKHYNNSKYYLQLSLTEGFGCALAEAMACGCIPIVSNVNILPDIAGKNGHILSERSPEALANLIKALDKNETNEHTRRRVVENYTVEKRQQDLFNILDETTTKR